MMTSVNEKGMREQCVGTSLAAAPLPFHSTSRTADVPGDLSPVSFDGPILLGCLHVPLASDFKPHQDAPQGRDCVEL